METARNAASKAAVTEKVYGGTFILHAAERKISPVFLVGQHPQELDDIKTNLQYAMSYLDMIEKQYSANRTGNET